ncbi:MAG: LPS export ABC transporter periplasmic protein LptC [Sphingomonadales bacterium]|nr:LPS export ABC transporter periplasmic protein LptC [Sphingomonadales bacterium]
MVLPDIDYRLYAVNLSLFDAASGGKIQLKADAIQHFRKQDELLIDKPVIDRFGKPSDADFTRVAKQNLRASAARVYKKGQSVLLYDGVTLSSSAAEKEAMSVMQTRSLWLYPAEKRAETAQSVQIQQGETTLSGRGLKADFATQSMELSHDVQAQVRPVFGAKPSAK